MCWFKHLNCGLLGPKNRGWPRKAVSSRSKTYGGVTGKFSKQPEVKIPMENNCKCLQGGMGKGHGVKRGFLINGHYRPPAYPFSKPAHCIKVFTKVQSHLISRWGDSKQQARIHLIGNIFVIIS